MMKGDIHKDHQDKNNLDEFNHYSSNMLNLYKNIAVSGFNQVNKIYAAWSDFYQTAGQRENNTDSLATFITQSVDYFTDFTQRQILFLDILRKRGNGYLDYIKEGRPPVLIFNYKILMDGRELKQPVNYALVEILPPPGIEIDPNKRPYVIIDPRAGHGSGIGGFKDDSQVGVALRAGHPVYFVIFFSEPEPHQTLRDVAVAENLFLHKVAERHPHSPKPCLIGNCQGGWAVMALSAARPDIAGVLVINGAPLSYWAGENGKNPMRYLGGILGGSWAAQLAGDLGNGKFDGANLVMNFEQLNPAETYWGKYYHLFACVDTEEQRFLNFERWWGGFTLLNASEMRGIVDNLFIGNKLAHGKIPLDHMNNIDLRKIRSPIIVFCSQGDNITPPQQALNWIADIYPNVLEIKLAGQVIVYLVHESIGHLGIFVSGNVAKKEHHQIVGLLEYIEHLPPGLYEMIIHEDKHEDAITPSTPNYHVVLKERTIDDIKIKSSNEAKDKELFRLVQAVSDFNVMGYDFFVSPMMRATSNELIAEWLREMHPLRMNNYLISDQNPLFGLLPTLAANVRKHRRPIADDNPYLQTQQKFSNLITVILDAYRELRDSTAELRFYGIYGLLRLVLPHDFAYHDFLMDTFNEEKDTQIAQNIMATLGDGGIVEAVIRVFLLIIKAQGFARGAKVSLAINKLRHSAPFVGLSMSEIREKIHTQTLLVEYEPELALKALPELLKTKKARRQVLDLLRSISEVKDKDKNISAHQMIERIEELLESPIISRSEHH